MDNLRKISLISFSLVFNDEFVIFTDLIRVADSSIATDYVTNKVTLRIFITNL